MKTVVEMLAEMARRRVPVVSVARRLEVDPSTAYRWSEGTSLPRGENYAGLIQMYDEVMKSPLPPIKEIPGNERDNAVLRMYQLGHSGAEIGRVLSLSRERVRQLLEKHGAKD